MIVSVSQGDRGRLYDANGVEITAAVSVDTDNGKVVRLRMDENGRLLINGSEPLMEEKQFDAPLRFVPFE